MNKLDLDTSGKDIRIHGIWWVCHGAVQVVSGERTTHLQLSDCSDELAAAHLLATTGYSCAQRLGRGGAGFRT